MLFGIFVDQRRLIEATIFLILGYIATDLALNKVYPEVQEKNSK
jgi:predicted tellurium resistance membrane protein TerC